MRIHIFLITAIFAFLLQPGHNAKEAIVCFETPALAYRSYKKFAYLPAFGATTSFILKYPAGIWKIPPRCRIIDLIKILITEQPINRTHKITIIDGMHAHDVLNILNNCAYLTGPMIQELHEGTILPETYCFKTGCSRKNVLKLMQQTMDKTLQKLWLERKQDVLLAGKSITQQEWIVLASIVQKEAATKADMIKVASCFLLRIRKDMRLQSDVTVLYGLKKLGVIEHNKVKVLWKHIKIDTEHNTYKFKHLPKTPICMPGIDALQAVLESDLNFDQPYFYACENGTILFAKTLDGHNKNKRICKLYK